MSLAVHATTNEIGQSAHGPDIRRLVEQQPVGLGQTPALQHPGDHRGAEQIRGRGRGEGLALRSDEEHPVSRGVERGDAAIPADGEGEEPAGQEHAPTQGQHGQRCGQRVGQGEVWKR